MEQLQKKHRSMAPSKGFQAEGRREVYTTLTTKHTAYNKTVNHSIPTTPTTVHLAKERREAVKHS